MTLATLKEALSERKPVLISYPVFDKDRVDLDARNFTVAEMTDAKKDQTGGHRVCIMGYQDAADAPGGGWFIVRNSWSDKWGDKGYCRVSYDTTVNWAYTPQVLQPYDKPFNAQYALKFPKAP